MARSPKHDFVPLHVHTCYSLLSGVGHPVEWAEAAARAGIDTLAVTDTDGLYGAMEHAKAAEAAGIRPLFGVTLTEAGPEEQEERRRPRARAVLLARDRKGFAALCRLITARRLEPDSFDLVEAVAAEAAGPAEGSIFVLAPEASLLEAWSRRLPPDTLHAELLVHPEEGRKGPARRQAAALAARAEALGVPVVATNASHFPGREGYRLHAVLRAIAGRAGLAQVTASRAGPAPARAGLRGPHEVASPEAWLKPPEAMARLFEDRPEALAATRRLAEACRVEFDLGRVRFPEVPLPDGETPFSRLWKICFAGARRRYRPLTAGVVDRLRHELETIEAMGFAPYFLIVHDILKFARRSGIPCLGRGSAAGSLALYALGATWVDPLANNLSFERFLNPERVKPPDVDLDFCWRRRDEVVEHVFQRYGRDRVAMLCTHVTFAGRSAIRETARAMGLPEAQIGRFTRRIPAFWHATRIEEAREKMAECRDLPLDEEPYRGVLELAVGIDGFPRHLSVHAGGLIVTPHRLTDLVPLERAAKGVVVTQYDMYGAEDAGFVKLDLLCQRSLSAAQDACRDIRQRYGFRPPLEEAEAVQSDPATRTLVREGDTMGCFYIESPAMRSLLRKLRVDTLADLTAASSVIRPGVAESGMMQQYIARHLGEEPVSYLHPALEEVMGETHGVMIYQEDVLYVAQHMAGLTPGEADLLRRAMSGKTRCLEAMEKLQGRFLEGCLRNGLTGETALEVWRQVESFAGYAFCKAHSASYAVLSFRTAFLRAHFPAEFMAAILSNQGGYYHASVYVEEARRMGLRLLLPDVNRSERRYTAEYAEGGGDPRRGVARRHLPPILPPDGPPRANAVRIGLLQVKGLTEATVEALLEARERDGFFTALGDFLRRVPVRDDELEVLVKVGAFDAFEWTRPELLWKVEEARSRRLRLERPRPGRRAEGVPQVLPGGEGMVADVLPFELWQRPLSPALRPRFLPRVPDWSLEEKIHFEMEHLDLTPSGHPMVLFRNAARERGCVPVREVARQVGRRARVAGWLAASKRVSTRKGEQMRFLTLEDETGMVEVTLFPRAYQRWGWALDGRGPYLAEGRVEEDHGALSLTAQRFERLPSSLGENDRAWKRKR